MSLEALSTEILEKRNKDPNDYLTFDKDHENSLNFLTAASNIRSHIFHIPFKSRFEVKQMAGNIIPAIATTNAIVAGSMVILAIKALSSKLNECKSTFVTYGGNRRHVLGSEESPKPNSQCAVCSCGYLTLELDLKTYTIKKILDEVITSESELCLKGDITIVEGDRY
jgi:ubiquitin-like 1-activating enzyme E1 B